MPHIYGCYSSRTSRLWWITHSMQHQRRGCNNIPSFLQQTTSIAHSFCESCTWHNLHILVAAPFCCDRKAWGQVHEAWQCNSKQHQRSCAATTLLLLVRATYIWVLFFTYIPFMVNRTFNATPTERLQQFNKKLHSTACEKGLLGCTARSNWTSSNLSAQIQKILPILQGWIFLLENFGTGKIYFDLRITHATSQSYSKMSFSQVYQHHETDKDHYRQGLLDLGISSFNPLVVTTNRVAPECSKLANTNGGRMAGAFTWPSCMTLLEMSTKPVNMRATTATRTGCVRHWAGHKTSFSGRGSRNAAEDPQPNILQLNTKGLTADKFHLPQDLVQQSSDFNNLLKRQRMAERQPNSQ